MSPNKPACSTPAITPCNVIVHPLVMFTPCPAMFTHCKVHSLERSPPATLKPCNVHPLQITDGRKQITGGGKQVAGGGKQIVVLVLVLTSTSTN